MKKENDNRVAVSFTEMSASKAPLLRRVQSASVFLFCAVLTLCLQPLQGQSQTLHLLKQTAQGSAAPQFPQPQIVPQNAYLWSIPVGLIATGTVLLNGLGWFDLNLRIRDALRYREYRARHTDDVLQFVPMSGAIGLDIYQIGRNENWQPLFEEVITDMKHLLALIFTVSIPGLFFFTVKQSQVYNTLEREVNAYNDEQNRLIAENKRKISAISILSKPQRIEKIAVEELGMHKADSSQIIRISLDKEKKG
ncbi:MAG: hypothetical protein ACFNLL_01120 [Bacteroides sp.]